MCAAAAGWLVWSFVCVCQGVVSRDQSFWQSQWGRLKRMMFEVRGCVGVGRVGGGGGYRGGIPQWWWWCMGEGGVCVHGLREGGVDGG